MPHPYDAPSGILPIDVKAFLWFKRIFVYENLKVIILLFILKSHFHLQTRQTVGNDMWTHVCKRVEKWKRNRLKISPTGKQPWPIVGAHAHVAPEGQAGDAGHPLNPSPFSAASWVAKLLLQLVRAVRIPSSEPLCEPGRAAEDAKEGNH